jgi:RNA methyltransferase, TrmH family
MKIISRDNSLLRRTRAVRDGRITSSIFVEGLRLCEEAVNSGLQIEAAIYSEQIARKQRAAELISKLAATSNRSISVSEKLLESISYTTTPQGIILLAKRPRSDEETFTASQPTDPLLVILHGVNNPVNVGAIARTAEAAGVTGVIATRTTSDPFSPKALRGAMGSLFRVPVWDGVDYPRVVQFCKRQKIRAIAAHVSAAKVFSEIDWRLPAGLILGPESAGLSGDELAMVSEAVRIPMEGGVESLNVAVAAGIMLYEARRQRAT